MNLGRFLKNLIKNCQRIRSKIIIAKHGKQIKILDSDACYAVKKHVTTQLLSIGLIGSLSDIDYLLRNYDKIGVKYKTIAKLGRYAKRKGKTLDIKAIILEYWRCKTIKKDFDIRSIPFRKFIVLMTFGEMEVF